MLRRLLTVAVFLVVPMGMLYPLWSCPTSAGEDDVVYYWPLRVMVARQERAGHWPEWNPTEACGVPLMGDPQSAVFFPATWLFLPLPARLAYSLSVFLAFSLAGGGAWLYLRRIGLARPAAGFGAAAFAFSGFFVGHRVHLGLVQAAGFLPWGLWCTERMRVRPSAGLALAPVVALTLAAGHWPTAVELMMVWGVYLLLRARPLVRAMLAGSAAVALGLALLAPQVAATAGALGQTLRGRLPYAVAGENSFFPLCAVLGLYPFLMGCRTPNLFPQPWWGPWHLCEMLGYAGLATLVLAGAAVWRLYRRGGPSAGQEENADLRRLVRLWTWLLAGAALWALGYYTPLYRLVYLLPVFGSVRCPARMLLVIDLALATLAAAGVHSLSGGRPPRLLASVRRGALLWLPACMLAVLVLVALLAAVEGRWWNLETLLSRPPDGSSPVERMRQAVLPWSPAVFVPLLLAGATAGAVAWVTQAPRQRAWALTLLVLADLFVIARFVDVPGRGRTCPDGQASPAAEFLRANAPPGQPYRVWGLGRSYHDRAGELLLPKTAGALGFETISYYGPLAPADYFLLLGFRPWGSNQHWQWLLRTNHLLSLLNVRYVLAADEEFRQVVESVRIPDAPPAPPGENLLGEAWALNGAEVRDGVLRLKAPGLWTPAWASQAVRLPDAPEALRISLEVRAPAGAGNLLAAEYVQPGSDTHGWGGEGFLRIDIEQVTPRWRHFERTFRAPARPGEEGIFRVMTVSERPVEVRNVALRAAGWETPINFDGRLAPGERVYADLTPRGLRPVNPGDPPVHVYENRLALPRSFRVRTVGTGDRQEIVEAMRWRAGELDLSHRALVQGDGGQDGTFVSQPPGLVRSGRGGEAVLPAGGLGSVIVASDEAAAAGPRRGRWVWVQVAAALLLAAAWAASGVNRRTRQAVP